MGEFIVSPPEESVTTGSSRTLTIGLGLALTISGAGGPAVVKVQDLAASDAIVDYGDESSDVSFRKHVAGWKAEMRSSPSSSVRDMFASEHYQRIIGMGKPAVPLLLAELQASPDHWDWALDMITGDNPVPPPAQGKLKEIARAWLDWGRARRLV
jgi:hypothetical protein